MNLETIKGKNGNIEYVENCPMDKYTSFRIGGKADIAFFPKNENELVECVGILCDNEIPFEIIGNGTNLLVSDEGIEGAAIILSGLKEAGINGTHIIAGAGCPLTRLASLAAEHSLTGLEFAYGIPGTVGGGVLMNAGAYGGQISDVLVSSRYYDVEKRRIFTRTASEHNFSYRSCAYMNEKHIILSAELELAYGDKDEITAKMNDLLARRKSKQPLEYPSAGSVFKRGEGYYTSQLIDEAGLKGLSVGGAQVSQKHSGFIINKGKATCKDVTGLIEQIKAELKAKFGVEPDCEIRFIGKGF